jgi:hypothetical protein
MWKWRKQEKPDTEVVLENGVKVAPVATFYELVDGMPPAPRGRAHIIVDDRCYVLLIEGFSGIRRTGRFRMTPWIFKEAHEALRELPLLDPRMPAIVETPER